MLFNIVMMLFYLVVMIRYSWILTLVGVLSVLLQILTSNLISKKRINITRVMMRDKGKLAATTTSAIEMIETIKASGAENGYFERWAGYQASVNTQNNRYQEINQYLGMIPAIITGLMNAAILIIGIWLTIQGKFTAGMIMAFQGFLAAFMSPVFSLIGSNQRMQEMQTDMERIDDVMEYPDDVMLEKYTSPSEAEEKEYGKLEGRLSMRHVTFGYAPLDKPLIEDFNLELQPGQRVAFVGASGCGKSTLSKLISGLYQPWSGEILLDGMPLREIDRDVFTSSLAVVDQDITLFEDTIANNIRMWNDTIEDYEVILAARDAQIHEDIMHRPGGYQYPVTEGGRDFSGGQRQRLEIARVLAQDPSVIIMDEATSALDARTEYDVVRSIKDRGITCIVIAHRLSTIRDSDEIIVMDQGRVVERGTHEQLMALGGAYKALVSSE
jgi:ABC-type bacteriocin/lantibiotic exporter with double-glycine peptidase domain